jgi:hypothetical protein
MVKQPTVLDLVKFILRNRKGKVFRDWSVQCIAEQFNKAFDENLAAYTVNKNGELTGIAIAELNGNVFRIKAILTTESMAWFLLYKKYLELYEKRNFVFCACRRGREICYNTEKLKKKVFSKLCRQIT